MGSSGPLLVRKDPVEDEVRAWVVAGAGPELTVACVQRSHQPGHPGEDGRLWGGCARRPSAGGDDLTTS